MLTFPDALFRVEHVLFRTTKESVSVWNVIHTDIRQIVSDFAVKHTTGAIVFAGEASGSSGVHGAIDNIIFRPDYCANTGKENSLSQKCYEVANGFFQTVRLKHMY